MARPKEKRSEIDQKNKSKGKKKKPVTVENASVTFLINEMKGKGKKKKGTANYRSIKEVTHKAKPSMSPFEEELDQLQKMSDTENIGYK